MIEIREAKHTDFEGIWPIMRAVLEEGETYPHSGAISEEAAFQYWMTTPTATYVAVEGDRVKGTYYVRPNQPGRGAHVCNAGYMAAPEARNRGVGTAMGRDSLDRARALGFTAMQFNLVVATNLPSIRIWERLGFEKVGTLPQAFDHRRLGLVDAFIMYRLL
ncbi:MAG: N-acetyltransferase family protein [Desulfobacteraceae bacterium]